MGLMACAQPDEEETERHSTAIVDGTASSDSATVALVARRGRCVEDPALLCSGALIAPAVVLTAAHCLDVFGSSAAYYEVFAGAVLPPPGEGAFARVREVAVHPDYDSTTHAYDLALLRLDRELGVAPYALPTGEDGLPIAGERARAVGFGEALDAGAVGVRREGTLTVSTVEAAIFLGLPSPSMTCSGDSGGPVLLTRDGGEVLSGITAAGDSACKSEAIQARVDVAIEGFITPFLGGDDGGIDAGFAVAGLCGASCSASSECPELLSCEQLEDGGGRCMLPALREGDFGATCSDDDGCSSGTCARLEPGDGGSSCRCFTPCDSEASAASAGCGGPAERGAFVIGALLALGGRLVRRSRSTRG